MFMDFNFSIVYEVHNGHKDLSLHSPHKDHWVRVQVLFKHVAEEWAAGSKDGSVSLNLLFLLTYQGDIREVCVCSQVPVCLSNAFLKTITFQVEFV